MALRVLSDLLKQSGDFYRSVVEARAALELAEALASENLAAHALTLSISLHLVSNRLLESGQYADGLTLCDRAVGILESLAVNEFSIYARRWSASLHTQAALLFHTGKPAQSLLAMSRVLEIGERLVEGCLGKCPPEFVDELVFWAWVILKSERHVKLPARELFERCVREVSIRVACGEVAGTAHRLLKKALHRFPLEPSSDSIPS